VHSIPTLPTLARAFRLAATGAALALSASRAGADEPPSEPAPALTLEGGAAWQLRNTARVPNEAPNTRFDLDQITGDGPFATGRVVLDWPLSAKHRLRFIVAPLSIDERGNSDQPIVFQDTPFAPGPIEVQYRFDSYRASYRYVFVDDARWTWSGGVTLNVRDAEIELRQGGVRRNRSNTGLVPLLALEGEWRFAPGWRAILDFEGLGAPQGRAIDAALKLGYEVNPAITLYGGYRILDGGADNDDLYTFARFDQAVLGLTWRFGR
jgi:hypothetical protein